MVKDNPILTIDIQIRFRGQIYRLKFTRLLKFLVPVSALIVRYVLRAKGII